MAVGDRPRTPAPDPVARPGLLARRLGARGSLVAQAVACLIGVLLLQLASHAVVPKRLDAGAASVLALGGDLLVAAGLAATMCAMLRLVLPPAVREVAAALASVATVYVAVVASFAGIDVVGAATPAEDLLVGLVLGTAVTIGLVLRGPVARPTGPRREREPEAAGGARGRS